MNCNISKMLIYSGHRVNVRNNDLVPPMYRLVQVQDEITIPRMKTLSEQRPS